MSEVVDVSSEGYIMPRLTIAVIYIGWLVIFPVCASSDEIPGRWELNGTARRGETMPSRSSLFRRPIESVRLEQGVEWSIAPWSDAGEAIDTLISDNARFLDVDTSHGLGSKHNFLFGVLGLSGERRAIDVPAEYDDSHIGRQNLNNVLQAHLLDAPRTVSTAFAAGYGWRGLLFEQSAVSSYRNDQQHTGRSEWPKLDSKSTRLSFNPAPNWTFRLSRGTVSGLDQLIPNEDVRRTSISATYARNFNAFHWQTTIGWGRYARKSRETMVGYLLESTWRFGGNHAMFGRLEQVGSDDLMRANDSLQRHLFKIRKLTLGYFQEIQPSASLRFDMGTMASRHFIPADMMSSYGRNPTSYMMFVRFKFQ